MSNRSCPFAFALTVVSWDTRSKIIPPTVP
jgi:hypothetical protein